jgi:hypothetical protein
MLGGFPKLVGALVAPGLLVLAALPASAAGDDTGFFGRLFRLGSNSSSSSSSNSRSSQASSRTSAASSPRDSTSAFGDIDSGRSSLPSTGSSTRTSGPVPATGPLSTSGPSTPDFGEQTGQQPRLSPRSRSSSAVTSADPLLTRMALGSSNDGSKFGMFLQVFADGTVIDSDGVHRLGASDIRPIVEAIQSGEVGRIRGHCGTPSNDFLDYVHIVVFERRMGRLQAHSFSYAGNPQGCDNGIRILHAALDNIQAKLSRQPAPTAGPVANGAAGTAVSTLPNVHQRSAAAPSLPEPGAGASTPGSVIPLTPLNPR